MGDRPNIKGNHGRKRSYERLGSLKKRAPRASANVPGASSRPWSPGPCFSAFLRKPAMWVLGLALGLLLFIAVAPAFSASIPSGVLRYAPDVIRASHAIEGLQGYPATRIAQLWQESKGDPLAKSPVGAAGLYQFMPATAKWWGQTHPELGVVDAFSPRWAIPAGIKYQVSLERAYRDCGPCASVRLGLRAYNSGSGWIGRDRRLAAASGVGPCDCEALERFNAGRSPSAFRENVTYHRLIVDQKQPAVEARFLVRGVRCAR